MSHGADPVKSILYALAANGGIAIAKYIAAIVTGSGAMFAEAIHSTADCGNQGLLLWGLKSAKAPPSPDYPLGYGKAIYFWSFIVALMLFTLGGVYSLYEGIHKLHSNEGLSKPWIAVGILAFSVVLEFGSLMGCLKEINKSRGSKPLLKWCKDTRESELVVVLGEDVAALGGLVLALAAVLLAIFTGDPVYDAYGTVIIGVLLLLVALFIAVKIKGLLIGQSVEPELREKIKTFIDSDLAVEKLLNSVTQQMGSSIMLAVKAKMKLVASGKELVRVINDCEKRIKAEFPQIKWVFFEPDCEE